MMPIHKQELEKREEWRLAAIKSQVTPQQLDQIAEQIQAFEFGYDLDKPCRLVIEAIAAHSNTRPATLQRLLIDYPGVAYPAFNRNSALPSLLTEMPEFLALSARVMPITFSNRVR